MAMDAAVSLGLAGESFERLSAGLHRAEDGHWAMRLGDVCMRSVFQPVFSLAHGRAVGHEALLRAHDTQGRDLGAHAALHRGGSFAAMLDADRAARLVHAMNFAQQAPDPHWLFLNMQPQVFVAIRSLVHEAFQDRLLARSGLAGHRIVIEVLEEAVPEGADFEGGLDGARRHGCLVALDDFGAGHSNFDRVWRLRPEIVKLDRSLVRRAALERQAQRVVAQMVALLHDCGSLVLLEGVQTEDEALVALDVNADLVQGEWFGAPARALRVGAEPPRTLRHLWESFEARREGDQRDYLARIRPYVSAIGYASALLAEGQSLDDAARGFLQLDKAEVCYLIDREGRQIGDNAWAAQRLAFEPPGFAPMRETEGAHWGRRPYFRRALENVGKTQVTRPYRTVHGAHLCVTISVAFRGGEAGLRVICGDLTWEGGAAG